MSDDSTSSRLLSSSNSDEDDDVDHNVLTLRVKSFQDVELQVQNTISVQHLKRRVRQALGPQAENRYLRLISKGRLLAPDASLLKDFSLQEGDVVHAVLAAQGVRGGRQAALARSSHNSPAGATRRYRGTGIAADGRVVRSSGPYSDEEEDSDEDEEEGRERLGFDRLRANGLSRPEISAIRAYFSRQVDRFVQNSSSHSFTDEPDAMRRRLLQEDAWMQAQGPASEFRLNLNQSNPLLASRFSEAPLLRPTVGTDRDFMWGFLLGFFVGFLMLVWVWMPTVPHKQKLGILTGISFQLAMNLLKDGSDHHSDTDLMDGD